MLPGASLTLQISQGYARLGIESKLGQYDIRQPKAQMDIVQRPAELSIEQRPGKLEIDSTEAWAALGYKSVFRMTKDIADQAHQIALQAIEELSAEGTQMSEAKPPSIGQLAQQRFDRGPAPISDSASASFDPVHIRYTPTPNQVNFTPHPAEIRVTPQAPIIQYNRQDVRVYIEQKNWINIEVRGRYMNQTL